MIARKLYEIAEMIDGAKLNTPGASEVIIKGVSKDTRTIEPGNLYIPISGPNFDGHDFLDAAMKNGAAASLWDRNHPLPDTDFPLIIVDDCLLALHSLAHSYRQMVNPTVVAITGSNGKTSVKDILSAVLLEKYRVVNNQGNQNNEIGVPLTILSLDDDTEMLIVEMGTERPGEIIVLTRMANPDISIITNIGDSHLKELITKENVAIEKLDIVKGMPSDGKFLYFADDPVLTSCVKSIDPKCEVLSYGTSSNCDYPISNIHRIAGGYNFELAGVEYRLPMIEMHQVHNSSAAISIALLLDMNSGEINRGLTHIVQTGMRSELKHFNGFDVLDDSYKSNPQNLGSALDTLYSLDGYSRKIAVLGDMLDLGPKEREFHYEIGSSIKPGELDYILVYGELMRELARGLANNYESTQILEFGDKSELSEELSKLVINGSIVLVKGSRGMRMETVVESLSKIKR